MRPSSTRKTFDNVQRIRANVRRYPDGWGEAHPLTGLMYCADCGGKMYVHRVNNGKRDPQFTCSQYSKIPCGTLCGTQHRIRAEAVLTLITICSGPSRSIPRMTGPSLSALSRKRRLPSRPLTSPRSGNGWPPPKSGPGNWKS